MTENEGIVAAQKQALSVRFNTGQTSLASCADLFLTCGSKRTFSVGLLLSPPANWVIVSPSTMTRQLSWRNKSAHSSVSCHFGGFDAVVCSKQVLGREAWRQLPPTVNNKSKQTYLPLQVQDKYSRRRHAWRWRVRKSKRRRNQGEEKLSGSAEEYGSLEWVNTGSHHPPSSSLLHSPQSPR